MVLIIIFIYLGFKVKATFYSQYCHSKTISLELELALMENYY